ncbi:MAG: hypothetical protein JW784_05320 [Candidatus Cloacimonetes bacterium]|nr:hypothetical protein [Candidatus Cloacimonadota bacterium]
MNKLDNDFQSKLASSDWSYEIARKVIRRKRAASQQKRNLLFSLLALITVIVSLSLSSIKSYGMKWENKLTCYLFSETEELSLYADIEDFLICEF